MTRGPGNYRFGLRHPGGGFLTVGEYRGQPVHWLRNPMHLLPRVWFSVVALWRHSQAASGRGWLPEAGGVHDQPAWLLEAFAILGTEDARIDRKERPG